MLQLQNMLLILYILCTSYFCYISLYWYWAPSWEFFKYAFNSFKFFIFYIKYFISYIEIFLNQICYTFIAYILFVVFDWFSLYIVWAPFVNIYSKEGFWKNQNITVFKKYFFDKIFFDICMMQLYQVYIHPWLTLMINSQIKFETLVFRLMKGLARNYLWVRVKVEKI